REGRAPARAAPGRGGRRRRGDRRRSGGPRRGRADRLPHARRGIGGCGGGAGRALGRAPGGGVPIVPLPHGHAWLIVVGSLHPTSRAYVEGAALSVPVVVAGSQSHTDPTPAIAALASGRPAVVAS